MRDVTYHGNQGQPGRKFLLTRPMRDVTTCSVKGPDTYRFLLTRPMRDVTASQNTRKGRTIFLLTRPMRDVTGSEIRGTSNFQISTHTSHAGRDRYILCLSAITHPHLGRTKLFIIRFLHFYGFCSSLSGEPLRNSHITPPSHAHKNHTIMTPSGSYVFLAPTCSTLFFQLFPR